MRRVDWSGDALDEFDGIVAFIARDNPLAANKVADHIAPTIHDPSARPTGPHARVTRAPEPLRSRRPYIVAYALGNEPRGHETITILRVIHGARDWREESWPD